MAFLKNTEYTGKSGTNIQISHTLYPLPIHTRALFPSRNGAAGLLGQQFPLAVFFSWPSSMQSMLTQHFWSNSNSFISTFTFPFSLLLLDTHSCCYFSFLYHPLASLHEPLFLPLLNIISSHLCNLCPIISLFWRTTEQLQVIHVYA